MLHQLHRLPNFTCLALVCDQNSIFSQSLMVSTDSHSQSCRPAAESRPGAMASWSVVLALVVFDLVLIRAAVAAVRQCMLACPLGGTCRPCATFRSVTGDSHGACPKGHLPHARLTVGRRAPARKCMVSYLHFAANGYCSAKSKISGATPAGPVRPLASWRRRSVRIQIRCESFPRWLISDTCHPGRAGFRLTRSQRMY